MRRLVSLWFPAWHLNRHLRRHHRRHHRHHPGAHPPKAAHPKAALPDAAPASGFALIEAQAHGTALVAVDARARAAGLRAGQSLSDARAICPLLAVAPVDRAADAADLAHLLLWLQRYTPWVSADGEDGALLDITGCAHLLGGEDALCRDVQARLRSAGIAVRLGVADTPGAAWALARFGTLRRNQKSRPGIVQQDSGKETLAQALGALPVACLRLSAETVDMLHRLGLKQVSDLLALPRAGLARRFQGRDHSRGRDLVWQLDQVLGLVPDPRVPAQRPPLYRTLVQPMEPVLVAAQIDAWAAELLARLLAQLAADAVGVRRLTLACFGVDGQVQHITVGCARASRDARHLRKLLAAKTEQVAPGFGLDALALTATHVAPLANAQASLEAARSTDCAAGADQLADSLINRFSSHAVHQLSLAPSHMPERAECRVAYNSRISAKLHSLARPPTGARRPLLLLPRPEPATAIAEVPDGMPRKLVWRRRTYTIARADGPERIAPEWWRAGPAAQVRDYYWIEDQQGVRLWVFRHGQYGTDAGPPGWFVHGMDS